MDGTNCANCIATKGAKSRKAEAGELNKQGGTIPENDKQLQKAEKSDLVTMPGKGKPTHVVWCQNKRVDQWVTERMCCALWDAPGTLRAYGKQSI